MQDLYNNYVTEDLVVMYQNTKQDLILEEIVSRNKGLIHLWAISYRNIPNYDVDDLVEEAVIACWKAVCNYDPDKGVRFSTCLKGYAVRALNRIYERETRGKRYNGNEPESYDALVELYNTGCIKSGKCHMDDYSLVEINEFFRMLNGTTKQVAELLLTGLTKSEVAEKLHITPASTSYHVKKIGNTYTSYKACLVG